MKFKKYKKGREFVADELYVKLVTENDAVKLVVVNHEGEIKTYLCRVTCEGLHLYAFPLVVETDGNARPHVKITKE